MFSQYSDWPLFLPILLSMVMLRYSTGMASCSGGASGRFAGSDFLSMFEKHDFINQTSRVL
jgi:hypothetical protein